MYQRSRLSRLSQCLLLLAGGFSIALLLSVYLESQLAAIATWWLFYALVPVALVWIVVFTIGRIRSHQSNESSKEKDPDALAVLRERYARGELTDDQFERKLDRLLEADTPENAAEWQKRSRDRSEERSRE